MFCGGGTGLYQNLNFIRNTEIRSCTPEKCAHVDGKNCWKFMFMKPPAQHPGGHFRFWMKSILDENLKITNMFGKFAM